MTFTDVLALNISINGVSDAMRGLDQIEEKLEGLDSAAMRAAKGGLAQLAALAATLGFGVREAVADEATLARLAAFTGGMEEALKVMERIDALGKEGVFDKRSIEQAAMTLEKSLAGAFEKNLDLLKELGVRMDGGIDQAAELIARLERGQTFGIAMQLGQAGFGPNQLREAGLNVKGRNIENSPEEILAALKELTRQQDSYERMVNTTSAAWGRFKDQMFETLEGVGYPFLTALNLMLEPITFMLSMFRELNAVTGGWASNVVVAMIAINGITKVLPLMTTFLGVMKQLLGIETILAVIRNLTWNNVIGAVGRFLGFLRSMLTIEKALAVIEAIRAGIQAAIAFAMGNVVGAVGALAILGAVGYGAYNALGGGGGASPSPSGSRSSSSERPQRRDDLERIYDKMQGRRWTG